MKTTNEFNVDNNWTFWSGVDEAFFKRLPKTTFHRDGYFILKREELHGWDYTIEKYQKSITKIFSQQLNKIDGSKLKDISEICLKLEILDKEAAYQAVLMCSNTQAAKQIHFSFLHSQKALLFLGYAGKEMINWHQNSDSEGFDNFQDYCIDYYAAFQFIGPQPLINLPSNKRLLYHWHSEANYYPKRRNFINVWFPLFVPKHEGNGTMWFAKGSHKHYWGTEDFVEYSGYDKDSQGKKNHFRQFEIPESRIKDKFEIVPVIAEPGDVVFFHRNLVHTSTINTSDKPSYAAVMRIFDPSEDYTLSGDMAVQPYTGNDYAAPGMVLE